jgi:hypothetical protein
LEASAIRDITRASQEEEMFRALISSLALGTDASCSFSARPQPFLAGFIQRREELLPFFLQTILALCHIQYLGISTNELLATLERAPQAI